jgi:hypothetical protein
MKLRPSISAVALALALGGCATAPGPGETALAHHDRQNCKLVVSHSAAEHIRSQVRGTATPAPVEQAEASAAAAGRRLNDPATFRARPSDLLLDDALEDC